MDNFYIITNKSKDKDLAVTRRVENYIRSKGKRCALLDDAGDLPDDADLLLTLGGDGTLIRAAGRMRKRDVPILGVNLGTLGYLAEVDVSDIEGALDEVIFGHPLIEERMMLKGGAAGRAGGENKSDGAGIENAVKENPYVEKVDDVTTGKLTYLALNDIVLTREGGLRLMRFNLYVNGDPAGSYQSDGIIISTPTGSTAYNLSAGGPILEPTASMTVITPICSHALSARSIVLSGDDTVELELGYARDGACDTAALVFDGNEVIRIKTGDRVFIRRAKETARLIKLKNTGFLETLRGKML